MAEGAGLLNRFTVKSRNGGSNPPLSASFYWGFNNSLILPTNFPRKFPKSSSTAQRREPGTEPERTGLESDGKFTGLDFRALHWPQRLFPKRLVTSLSPFSRSSLRRENLHGGQDLGNDPSLPFEPSADRKPSRIVARPVPTPTASRSPSITPA